MDASVASTRAVSCVACVDGVGVCVYGICVCVPCATYAFKDDEH